MSARFGVTGTFNLSQPKNFVIVGEILDGIVKPGMLVPLPDTAPDGCSGRIVGVESVDNLSERIFRTGLRVQYESAQELSFWLSLPLEGSEIYLLPEPPAG